jgi:hypothetical protein
MAANWQNPEFVAKQSVISSETMTRLNADPEFRANTSKAASEWMTRQWQDNPEFRAHQAAAVAAAAREPAFRETARETMTRQWRDNPEFRAKSAAASSDRMTRHWAEYRAQKAQSNAAAGDHNGASAVSSETPQTHHRARSIKLARPLTHE